MPLLGVRQKNGSPGHPQTQGKTERFHQTLQRWLAARPAVRTVAELQRQLEEFREHYNRMTLRRAGRMHHLHTGVDHARKRVLAFADDHQVTVVELTTGEVLSRHLIKPNKTYWRNEMREPGRWPSPQK